MIINVNEAEGVVLDWLVARAEGMESRVEYAPLSCANLYYYTEQGEGYFDWIPTRDWTQAGPIIESHAISLNFDNDPGYLWAAWTPAPLRDEAEAFGYGNSMLIAAMRCYVISKLGDQVEVPEELCQS